MIAAGLLGWLVRHKRLPRRELSTAISAIILSMMLLIGVEVGLEPMIFENIENIGIIAIVLTLGAVVGSWLTAGVVWRYVFKVEYVKSQSSTKLKGMGFSFLIVGIFATGVFIGAWGLNPSWCEGAAIYALYLLMACVGFSLGSDNEAIKALRSQPIKVFLVPLATIVGTYAGVLSISWFISDQMSLNDQLAIGSGFGYYSLSSVLLSELKGAEIGAIALLVNVMRELITVVAAPLIVRYFSPFALICSGGATTLDVTLPIIITNCGSGMVAVAIFQGVVVDLSVPFLVTLFATI